MQHADWTALTDEQQIALAREALRHAAATLADHAEVLAGEMEVGTLHDKGGPDALRLFAAVVRATDAASFGLVGHA
jgi:Mor family transcriptional regulator